VPLASPSYKFRHGTTTTDLSFRYPSRAIVLSSSTLAYVATNLFCRLPSSRVDLIYTRHNEKKTKNSSVIVTPPTVISGIDDD
jgi:hypothetical protein